MTDVHLIFMCEEEEEPMDWDAEIGEEDEAPLLIPSPEFDAGFEAIDRCVSTYGALMWGNEASLAGSGVITLSIPISAIPMSMQAVYGFSGCDSLLDISLLLSDYSWQQPPELFEAVNPIFQSSYIGRPLVMKVVDDFFSGFYKPRQSYRSASFLLRATGNPSEELVRKLTKDGVEENTAKRALALCDNNLEDAKRFLRTGDLPSKRVEIPVSYGDCQLLYLVLEITEAFLDLSDHCCICRTPLAPGLKPSVCSSELCAFQYTEIGLGTSVYQEILRDPEAADLVVSLFSAAYNTPFLTPAPPEGYLELVPELLAKLPAMADILGKCRNDSDIVALLGKEHFFLLRWVLLSNRSHLISVPREMQLKEFAGAAQFMTLLSSPEAETQFDALKRQFGGLWLFHGSQGCRWHSILRNGLRNATGTTLQANGAALGPGIYFARQSGTSWGYSRPSPNLYANSKLGKSLPVLSLCEVAQVPSNDTEVSVPCLGSAGQKKIKGHLKDHGWAHTLTMEQACIVRFLFVGQTENVDTITNPPARVPTLREILEHHANHAK